MIFDLKITYFQFFDLKIVHNSLFSLMIVKMDLAGFAARRFNSWLYKIQYQSPVLSLLIESTICFL